MAKSKKAKAKKAKKRGSEEKPAEASTENSEEYKIGRGKPPLHTRFRKGDGRKRPGRRKGSKNLATLFLEAADQTLPATINGKRKRISHSKATIMQLATKAAGGDLKAGIEFLDRLDELERRAAASHPSDYPISEADVEVIREVHGRLWQYKTRE